METTLTNNKSLLDWLDEKVELLKPSKIMWIDGSKEQIDALKAEAVETGEMIKLNEELLPDCYLHRTAENDVARVEDRTLICSKNEKDAGPTNHWMDPEKAYKMLYDTKGNSQNICGMANEVYIEMGKMDEFNDVQQKLLDMKRELKANIEKYKDVKNIIINSRKRVYAHNDQEYHWFTAAYIDNWGMTDQTYDDIFEISNVCLDYCNEILNLFNIRPVYEYSNHDDVKHLFGMKTVRDEKMELLDEILG